jgi:hypothetical protein
VLEDADWSHYLLFRRSCTAADDWQAYVALVPQGCELGTLVGVAGRRGCIEQAFEAAKQETGLDGYEVRSAHGWYRHVTLVLWAPGPAGGRARDRPGPAAPQKKGNYSPCYPEGIGWRETRCPGT